MATCSITFCLKSAIASESFIGLPVLSCCPTQLVLSRAAGVIRYKILSEHVSLLLKTFQRAPDLRAEAKSLTKTLQGPSTLPLPRRPHLSLLMFLQPHFRVLMIFLSGMLFFSPRLSDRSQYPLSTERYFLRVFIQMPLFPRRPSRTTLFRIAASLLPSIPYLSSLLYVFLQPFSPSNILSNLLVCLFYGLLF